MAYKANPHRYSSGMKYRTCGNSGIKLPIISLGFWHNFGSVDNFETATDMVKFAFDNGITHFDLANNYGPIPGSAETNFGRIFKKDFVAHRDEMIITTKAGHLMWDGLYGDGGSRKYLMSSLDQSLNRMQLDYVDIFYSHRFDPFTPIEETLQALVDIVKQGKALYIGISKYPAKETIFAYKFLKEQNVPCLIHQDRYSMFARDIEEKILPIAGEHGVGFVAFSPLAQGLLTNRYLHGIPAGSRAARPEGFLQADQVTQYKIEKAMKLNELAENRGQTLAEMALAWALRDQRMTSLIIGASSVAQLADNLKAIENLDFSEDELKQIDNILRRKEVTYNGNQ
ncbi:MAG: aldo/keto reductase [Bacteroidales bacterium]|nr:aldo/keto reductase [Bacteroidales bacterium]